MKLFSVYATGIHNDCSTLIVAKNDEDALEMFNKRNDDNSYYLRVGVYELNEIDGYKVVFHKDKKIALVKEAFIVNRLT